MGEDDTKALARELERFHALIYRVTNAKNFDSPIPTKIFAFRRSSQLHKFVDKWMAGVFWPGVRQNQILLSDYSRRLGASEIILHEYVHFVVRNGRDAVYPIWYDEGFAEFLSTARLSSGDRMAIGDIPKARIPSFQYGKWLPMEQIITAKRYSDIPKSSLHMLYAESWALVHYLTLGRPEGADMPTELGRYLLRIENGLPEAVAFEHAFGLTINEANEQIRHAIRFGSWAVVGLPVSDLEFDRSEPIVRRPARDAIAVDLGRLALRARKFGDAESYFIAAIAQNPNNSRAHAGLGDALKFQGHWDTAEPHFQRAIDIDPGDVLNLLDQAEYLHDLAESGSRPLERRDLLLEARTIYRRSLAIEPESPEALSQLGRTYLNIGDDPAKGVEFIEEAFDRLPSSSQLSQMLAWAYVATDQEDKARRVLTKFIAVREKGDLNESLDDRIAKIRAEMGEN